MVEDQPLVADAVKDTLEFEGWRVVVCADGLSASHEIESDTHFDLIVLDYQLPGGLNGVELIQPARSLTRTQRTPIVMLSGSEVEREALAAGADAFMKKPDDIKRLTDTVTRLLAK